jgi:hypothetical protein
LRLEEFLGVTAMGIMEAFKGRADLEAYGNNALLLFALELNFGIEDIHSVAAESITDGKDDKKCDLIYIDIDSKKALVAQSYYSASEKSEAPANKASDLNTAAGCALSADIDTVPLRLKPAIQKLRDSISNGTIIDLQFWYVHNCNESENVKKELIVVNSTLHSAVASFFPDKIDSVLVSVKEVGIETLESWYQSQTMTILVSDDFDIEVPGGYEVEEDKWKAFITSVPGSWLYDVFADHKDNIFSANVRGYLGSRKSDQNINNGIKTTAVSTPKFFFVCNNGLTILTNKFEYDKETSHLMLHGLSIVNGAQTTGALGSLGNRPSNELKVLCRFVCCSDQDVIKNIIIYNNCQNQIEASDFRSNDIIQKRLREEFDNIPSITYLGGRRGGFEDKIKRPPNFLPSGTAGQVLAAFHGDPVIAYNEKSKIWDNNAIYSMYFSEKTTAKHILFCYSLLKAILFLKAELQSKNESDLTEDDKIYTSFLRNRGSQYLLLSSISACMELILNKPISDRFRLSFSSNLSTEKAIELWIPIVKIAIAFVENLTTANAISLKNKDEVNSAIRLYKQLMSATKAVNSEVYSVFSANVTS